MSVRTSLAIRRGAQIFGPPRTPVLQAAVTVDDPDFLNSKETVDRKHHCLLEKSLHSETIVSNAKGTENETSLRPTASDLDDGLAEWQIAFTQCPTGGL